MHCRITNCCVVFLGQILLVGSKVAALAGMAAAAYQDGEGFRKRTNVGDACIFVNRDGRGQKEGQVTSLCGNDIVRESYGLEHTQNLVGPAGDDLHVCPPIMTLMKAQNLICPSAHSCRV
jgi:hypothetical protein